MRIDMINNRREATGKFLITGVKTTPFHRPITEGFSSDSLEELDRKARQEFDNDMASNSESEWVFDSPDHMGSIEVRMHFENREELDMNQKEEIYRSTKKEVDDELDRMKARYNEEYKEKVEAFKGSAGKHSIRFQFKTSSSGFQNYVIPNVAPPTPKPNPPIKQQLYKLCEEEKGKAKWQRKCHEIKQRRGHQVTCIYECSFTKVNGEFRISNIIVKA